jgi:hypothetical protein
MQQARRAAAMLAAMALAACASTSKVPQAHPAGAQEPVSQEVRDALAILNRGHSQKMQLAFYATSPLLRNISPQAKPFFVRMGEVHEDLQRQLKKWASAHKVHLTFHYSNDLAGRAQKLMEDRQEKVIRSDSNEEFQRDILINMQMDHDWESSLISATLPMVQDRELRGYLENSLRAHESAAKEIRGLLEKYRFSP